MPTVRGLHSEGRRRRDYAEFVGGPPDKARSDRQIARRRQSLPSFARSLKFGAPRCRDCFGPVVLIKQ